MKKKENSAGGVVFYEEGNNTKILLIKDKYGKWALPKGHIEEGEDMLTAAEREIHEETGVELAENLGQVGEICFSFTKDYDGSNDRIVKTVTFFLFRAESTASKGEADEKFRWFDDETACAKIEYENAKNILIKAIGMVKKWKK